MNKWKSLFYLLTMTWAFMSSASEVGLRIESRHRKSDQVLLEPLNRAQEYFLSAPKELSIQSFQKIVQMRFDYDWSDQSRAAIQYALVRLAQLSDKSSERRDWINQSIDFDPTWKPNSQIFEPPIIQQYADQLNQRQFKKIQVPPSQKYKAVLINGKVFELKQPQEIPLPFSKVRIVGISNNRFQELSEQDLKDIKFDAVQASSSLLPERNYDTISDETPNTIAPPFGNALIDMDGKKKSIFKNNWFWVSAVAILGTGLYLHNQNSKGDRRTEPTHRTGF